MPSKFEVLRWQGTIDGALRGFLRIDEIVSKSDPGNHRPKLSPPPADSPHSKVIAHLQIIQKEAHKLTFEQARALYRRQMIVYVITLAESMIKDFAYQLFLQHPKRMIEFTGVGKSRDKLRGYIHLKTILQAKSKQDIVASLSMDASTRVASKLKETNFGRLERIGKRKLPDKLKNELVETIDLRNRIIHDHSKEKVTTELVVHTFDGTLKTLSGQLEKMAQDNDIPTDREAVLELLENLGKQQNK